MRGATGALSLRHYYRRPRRFQLLYFARRIGRASLTFARRPGRLRARAANCLQRRFVHRAGCCNVPDTWPLETARAGIFRCGFLVRFRSTGQVRRARRGVVEKGHSIALLSRAEYCRSRVDTRLWNSATSQGRGDQPDRSLSNRQWRARSAARVVSDRHACADRTREVYALLWRADDFRARRRDARPRSWWNRLNQRVRRACFAQGQQARRAMSRFSPRLIFPGV